VTQKEKLIPPGVREDVELLSGHACFSKRKTRRGRQNVKKNIFVITMLIVVCVWFPQSGFSKDERAGLYAGPLSVVAETLVEKAGSDSEDAAMPLRGAKQQYRGEMSDSKKRANEIENKSPLSSPSTPDHK
jgi:hypothetical protein